MYKRYAKRRSDPNDIECPKVWQRIETKSIDLKAKLKNKWSIEEEIFRLSDVVDDLQ